MDIRKIKKLIELVEASNIDELEISSADESIRIKCSPNKPRVDTTINHLDTTNSDNVIYATMAGTFYRAPSVDMPPYTEINHKIDIGDTVGMIETMTIMNKISSDKAGTITKFAIENGEFIEVGQPILIIN